MLMTDDFKIPGQPISIPRGPAPQLSAGVYSRDGQIRASLVGVPSYQHAVGVLFFIPLDLNNFATIVQWLRAYQ
jgi:exosome complex RNA-binding protein Rrp4